MCSPQPHLELAVVELGMAAALIEDEANRAIVSVLAETITRVIENMSDTVREDSIGKRPNVPERADDSAETSKVAADFHAGIRALSAGWTIGDIAAAKRAPYGLTGLSRWDWIVDMSVGSDEFPPPPADDAPGRLRRIGDAK